MCHDDSSPTCTYIIFWADIAHRKKDHLKAEKESSKSLLPSSSEDDGDNEDDGDDLSSYSKKELWNMVRNLRRKIQKEVL